MNNPRRLRPGLWLLILLLGSGLAACRGAPASPPESGEVDLFRPPPAAPQTPLVFPLPTASPTPLPERMLQPTPTLACSNQLRFLEDLTIPDGTAVAPGAPLDKQWRVENSGTCNWDFRYRLRLIQGPDLGATPDQALYPARSGTQAIIRLLFTAPQEPGIYRSAWQAHDPQGQPFGDVIYIEFVVR